MARFSVAIPAQVQVIVSGVESKEEAVELAVEFVKDTQLYDEGEDVSDGTGYHMQLWVKDLDNVDLSSIGVYDIDRE